VINVIFRARIWPKLCRKHCNILINQLSQCYFSRL